MSFAEVNGLISTNQSTVRAGTSTVTHLEELGNFIGHTLDNRRTMKILSADIAKAFDRVWHGGLLYKVHKLRIRGSLLWWIKDYLEDRFQRVVIGVASGWRRLKAGVPQGSILGPLLFIIFIDDISASLDCYARLFADDVNIFSIGKTDEECTRHIQPNIDRILQWARKWKVVLNPLKTESLSISRTKQKNNTLYMDGVAVKNVEKLKHLGVTALADGKWAEQVDEMEMKTQKKLGILRRYNHNFNRKTLSTLYKTFIRPSLEYASTVWMDITEGEKKRIENINLKAARIITGTKVGTSHRGLYKETALGILEERRRASQLVTFYKLLLSDRGCALNSNYLTRVHERHSYSTRNKDKLSLIKTKTESYRRCFLPDSVRLQTFQS